MADQVILTPELRQRIIESTTTSVMQTALFAEIAAKNIMVDVWAGRPNMIGDVRDFHYAFGHPVLPHPQFPSQDRIDFRVKFVEEEAVTELKEAVEARDLPGVADAIADAIYVLIGMAHEFGIPLAHVWNEVQRANMAKLHDGKVVYHPGTTKVKKPDDWKAPDIAGVLRRFGYVPQ